jgi:DNA-binding MarR family transcriptional regulator
MRCKEGRTNCLYLTESGWALMSHITPGHDERLYQLLSVLTPEEIRQLGTILRKLERNVE